MSKPVPRSIQEYLDQLRAELAGADPALIQDAVYDAEEYIRGEMDSNRGKSEEEILAAICTSYGAPEEVAEAYRTTEAKVQQAMRTPRPKPRKSALGRFFSVYADPYSYTALLYMLLALPIGIFCFVWTLVEGRIVEVMLGIRMPRRPVSPGIAKQPMMERIKEVFVDPRTWSTILYMLVLLPLGILYFTFAIAVGSTALSLIFAPIEAAFTPGIWFSFDDFNVLTIPWIFTPILTVFGLLLLTGLMYTAKGVAWFHGHLAKNLLVKAA